MPSSQIDNPFKVLSFGAGAIGTYIGGSLALAGHNVVFVEQPRVVDTLRERGLRLDLTVDKRRGTNDALVVPPGDFVVVPSLQAALDFGPFDFSIFALKSFDTRSALESMKPFIEKLPPILCLSNGVDNEPAIADLLGPGKVIYGTVTSAIGRRGAGDIVLEKLRGLGVAGNHPLSGRIAPALEAAHLNSRVYLDALSMKWSKMLTNLVANPTSAILDMTAAQVFADPRLYSLEIQMLRECLAVMHAQNLTVVDLPGTPVKALALATKIPFWLSKPFLSRAAGSGRGGKMPSFHIDLYSGRGQSEVDYLHGAVVRAGRKFGVSTPVNEFLTNTLLALTRNEIPREEYRHNPERLLSALG